MYLLDLTHYDFYQAILTCCILILGLTFCIMLAEKYKDLKYIISLYVWHTIFSVFYWYFSLSNTADSKKYFSKSFELTLDFRPGTRFTETITSIITRTLDSNYLNTNLVFNIFGALGLVLLYLAIKKYIINTNKFFFLVLFIPSMSFWSSSIGKDSIAFLAICLFIFSVTGSNRSKLLVLLSFLIMFLVRPHVAFMMLVSFLIYYTFSAKVHVIIKLFFLPIVLAISSLVLRFLVTQFAAIDSLSLEGFDDYIEDKQSNYQSSGSAVDLSSMSYPMQLFTYLFRPLPFEAYNIMALITSLENSLLLFTLIYLTIKIRSNLSYFINGANLWLFTYFLLTCSMLAMITANLGIATRQKWMILPVLIFLLLSINHEYSRFNANRQ